MKKVISLLLVLVMALSLIGAAALAEGEKVKLTVSLNDSNDTGESGYRYQWLMNTYNAWDKKDQVELDIHIEPVTDSDFFTKMQLQMGDVSTCPDVILYDTFQLQADVAAGYPSPKPPCTGSWRNTTRT